MSQTVGCEFEEGFGVVYLLQEACGSRFVLYRIVAHVHIGLLAARLQSNSHASRFLCNIFLEMKLIVRSEAVCVMV